MKNKILVALFLSVVPAAAQVQKVDISKELSSVGVADLYQATAKKTGALSPLAKLKDFEIHLKWNECISLAPQVFATHKEVRGWVAQTWLLCLAQGQKKKVDVPAVFRPLPTSTPEIVGGAYEVVLVDGSEAWSPTVMVHL